MSATTDLRLTKKQRAALDIFAAAEEPPRVVGWDSELRGPILQFATGKRLVVTRDGGMDFPR